MKAGVNTQVLMGVYNSDLAELVLLHASVCDQTNEGR